MKKKSVLFVSVLLLLLSLSNCEKHEIEDTTKFSTKSIVGTWVAVNSQNKVLYYYVIKDDKNLLYVDGSYICFDCDEDTEYAIYDPSDGYMHSTSNFSWTTKGDMTYTFDESKQVIRCHTGTLMGFSVKFIVEYLGSDEIFDVERLGLDEAMIYDKTGWLLDAHVYRIKGEKKDLSK